MGLGERLLATRFSRRDVLRNACRAGVAAGGIYTIHKLSPFIPDEIDPSVYVEQLIGRPIAWFYHNSADSDERFQTGVESGANAEADIRFFRGSLFSKHEQGALEKLSLVELAQQSVEAIFEKVKNSKRGVNIDIKFSEEENDQAMPLLYQALQVFDENVPIIFTGTNHLALRRLSRDRPNQQIMLTINDDKSKESFDAVYEEWVNVAPEGSDMGDILEGMGVMLKWGRIRSNPKEQIEKYRKIGLLVGVYGANDPLDFVTLANFNVECITTDNVGVIKQV